MQYVFARFVVVFSVTLQDFPVFQGVFDCNERRIGFLLVADKENERFFADEFLVVTHSADAVMQHFAFTDKVSRAVGDNTDKSASFRVLQG